MLINGKVAVVTGAASGIGLAVANRLAKECSTVVLVDLNPDVVERSREIAQETGTPTAAFCGDCSDINFIKEVFDSVEKNTGKIVTICVPAAGITLDGLAVKVDKETKKVVKYSPEKFTNVLNINLVAPTYWAVEMFARLVDKQIAEGYTWNPKDDLQATAVFIGSISSQGNKGQIAYAATKRALEGVASTLTKEGSKYGLKVGVVHPGFTDTPMVAKMGQELVDKIVTPNTQLKRLINVTEIADTVHFMISNSAIYKPIWADAGWHSLP